MTAKAAEILVAKLDAKRLGRRGKTEVVRVYQVTCRGLDFLTLVGLRDHQLGYIDEGGMTYRLSRSR